MFTPTSLYGHVSFLGVNDTPEVDLQSRAVNRVRVTLDGFDGESHGGATRPSCSRVLRQYPTRGTELRNTRQVSILSVEEMALIAAGLGLDHLAPEWLGVNLLLKGIPDLSQLPPSSRLIFDNGTALVVDTENGPCKFPAQIIEANHPGHGLSFPKVARGLRGVVGWVERAGEIAPGDRARLHIPQQRVYAHAG